MGTIAFPARMITGTAMSPVTITLVHRPTDQVGGTSTRICATSPLPYSRSVSIAGCTRMSRMRPADHATGETVRMPWRR